MDDIYIMLNMTLLQAIESIMPDMVTGLQLGEWNSFYATFIGYDNHWGFRVYFKEPRFDRTDFGITKEWWNG